jgi:hypothetical protein
MWPFVTILWLAKSGHNEDDWRKLQQSFFIWLFVKAKSRHNAAGFRKLQKSGFSWLFLGLFFTFWDGQLLYCKNRHIVTVTNVTICDDFVTR